MSKIVKIENLKDLIVELRGQSVLLDSDVAKIYGVETRDVNKAVTNNPEKFPAGYVVELSKLEKSELVENFHRFNKLKHSAVNPKAFPEQGLYMLATILKSPQAVQATLAIIETFAKIRQLSRSIQELSIVKDKADQKALMQRSGEPKQRAHFSQLCCGASERIKNRRYSLRSKIPRSLLRGASIDCRNF